MKILDNMLDFLVAVYFALAIGGLYTPLYFKKDKVSNTSVIPGLQPDPEPLQRVEVQIWTSKKANGLTRYHFKNKEIYFEVWAKDQPTAVKKFRRQFGKASY